ncbi:MAG: hypothetical protein V1690_02245 [Candidatus Moraniibacteriota bacterium]
MLSKKIAAYLLPVGLVLALPFVTGAKTISVDGVFTDWDDVATLVDETDFTGQSAEFSEDSPTYYYSTTTDSWSTTDPGTNVCKVNYNYMVAVDFIKMTNDNNYLYLLWERGTDFMDFRWDNDSGAGNYYTYSATAVPTSAPHSEFSGTPPCAGHVITAPAAFDHDMVISVDKDKNGTYDYYLVINVQYPAGWSADGQGYDTIGYVLQDSGNGAYDGIASETKLTTFGDDGLDVGISASSYVGVRQEWRMSISDIFTDLGINWDSSVNVRYEAHSLNPSDTSDAVSYTFAKDKVIKLSVNNKKKTNKSSIRLNGKTVKGATVKIYVNGTDAGTIKVNKGGTFHKTVSHLQKGTNTIRIFASHISKGTKNISKTITRKSKK